MYEQAITFLLKALAEYFEYKSKSFFRDSYLKSKKTQLELINEIEKLRDTGTSADADRADFLQQQLLEERAFVKSIEHISTKYSDS